MKYSVLTVLFLTLFSVTHGQIYHHNEAAQRVPDARVVRVSPESQLPIFIELNPHVQLSPEHFEDWIKKTFQIEEQYSFRLKKKHRDRLGYMHHTYEQLVDGHPVVGGGYHVHSKA